MSADRLAILAHELRSPVAALGAIVEAYPDAAPEQRRRLLELARSALAGIERLLADDATASLRIERIDAGALVRDVAETAALRGCRIEVRAEKADLAVQGDPDRLRQALDNLVANAIGHSPPDGVVSVAVGRVGDSVAMTVADQGEGIAAADLDRVFEPGLRLTTDRPGSGLGLAVVRAIARAHGGEVEVESSPGQGSTFRLVLRGASAVP
jgi:signal transduction histidine kinase